jgi:hypothetical protein
MTIREDARLLFAIDMSFSPGSPTQPDRHKSLQPPLRNTCVNPRLDHVQHQGHASV